MLLQDGLHVSVEGGGCGFRGMRIERMSAQNQRDTEDRKKVSSPNLGPEHLTLILLKPFQGRRDELLKGYRADALHGSYFLELFNDA